MTVDQWAQAHPYLTATLPALASWHLPTPLACWRWLGSLVSLLKGATMQFNATDIHNAIEETQKIVALALKYVPGESPDQKAATITAEVQPLFAAALAELHLPGLVTDFAVKILGWMIAAEVKAAEAVHQA